MNDDRHKHDETQFETSLASLRRAIDEGDSSGIAEGDVFSRVRKQVGLPPRK